MTREKASELWEVIKAYGEGKTIQYKARDTGRWCDWKDSICSDCTFYDDVEYRIKPNTEMQSLLDAQIGGKTIQHQMKDGEWKDVIITEQDLSCDSSFYRIKPEEDEIKNIQKELLEEAEKHKIWLPKNKHYKPFEDTAELMVHYSKHFNIDFPPFYEPIIWVKNKYDEKRFLIIGYDEETVDIGISKFTMKDLFRQCVFLDGSPIGQEE